MRPPAGHARCPILLLGLALATAVTACKSADERANTLYVEASRDLEAARALADTDAVGAADRLEDAAGKLDRILAKYPGSALAVRLTDGSATIAGTPYPAFRDTLLPAARARIAAARGFVPAARHYAYLLGYLAPERLARVGRAYDAAGEHDTATATFRASIAELDDEEFPTNRIVATVAIARELRAAERRPWADSLMREALHASSRFANMQDRASALGTIIGDVADQRSTADSTVCVAATLADLAAQSERFARSAMDQIARGCSSSVILKTLTASSSKEGFDAVATFAVRELARRGAFDEALQLARELRGDWWHDEAIEDVMLAQVRGRNWSAATTTAASLRDADRRAAVLAQITAYERGAPVDTTMRSFPTVDSLQLSVEAQVAAGDLEGARVRVVGLPPDASDAYQARKTVAIALAQRGDVEGAIRLANVNSEDYAVSLTRAAIARTLVGRGELERAVKLVQREAGDPSSATVIGIAVRRAFEAGDSVRAEALWRHIPDRGSWTDTVHAGLLQFIAARSGMNAALARGRGMSGTWDSLVAIMLVNPDSPMPVLDALDVVAGMSYKVAQFNALLGLATRYPEAAIRAKPEVQRRLLKVTTGR